MQNIWITQNGGMKGRSGNKKNSYVTISDGAQVRRGSCPRLEYHHLVIWTHLTVRCPRKKKKHKRIIFLSFPHTFNIRLNRLISTEKSKQQNQNLVQHFKIQIFIHNHHQHQISTSKRPSQTVSILHCYPTIRRPPWPQQWNPIILSTGIHPSQTSLTG